MSFVGDFPASMEKLPSAAVPQPAAPAAPNALTNIADQFQAMADTDDAIACSIMCSKDSMVVDEDSRTVTASCAAVCGPTAVRNDVAQTNPLNGEELAVSCFAICAAGDDDASAACEMLCRQGDGNME